MAGTVALLMAGLVQPAQAVRPLPSYTAAPLDSPEPEAGTAPQDPGAFFGEHMDAVADIDHDGVKDVAISSSRQSTPLMPHVGRVWVFSGRTREVIRTIQNPEPQAGNGFGDSIVGLGDVNGDGTGDLAIAAAGQDVDGTAAQGRVYIFSGRTESVIRTIEHPDPQADPYAYFGYGFALATGDLDGDGMGDFVETAEGQTVGQCDADGDPNTPPTEPCPFVGVAYAFSARTGEVIHKFDYPDAPEPYAAFGGGGVTDPGDVTGDGVDDIVIGAPFSHLGHGAAYLFNGKTGGLVRSLVAPTGAAGFGYGNSTGVLPGDVNRDGVKDVFAVAPGTTVGGIENAGRGYLLSGKDGSIIRPIDDPHPKKIGSFGFNHSNAGDLNGDGTADLLVSRFIFRGTAYGDTPPPGGAAYVFDPRTGAALVSLPGMTAEGPGTQVASPGDVNGDGYPDYFLGGQWMDGDGATGEEKGRVIVELSKAPPSAPAVATPLPACTSAAAKAVLGTAASDHMTGTSRGDRIFAGAGDDLVEGLEGDDCIDLGPGADRGLGGTGDDLVIGGGGKDRMAGGSGTDRLRGGASADRLKGGSGDDRLNGNSGNDRINGGSGNDILRGGSGKDRIKGSKGRDRLSGGSGADRIGARDGRRDKINCGSGRDRVFADRIDVVARNCERVRRRR